MSGLSNSAGSTSGIIGQRMAREQSGTVIYTAFSTLDGDNLQSTTNWQETGLSVVCPAVWLNAGSKVIVSFMHKVAIPKGSTHCRCDWRVRRIHSSDVNLGIEVFNGITGTTIDELYLPLAGTCTDDISGVTTATTAASYILAARRANNASNESGSLYYRGANTGAKHYIQIQVIK